MIKGVRKILFLVLLLSGLWVLAGCSSSGQVNSSIPQKESQSPIRQTFDARRYPEEQFMTAWGASGKSPRAAELDAKVRISEQISSRIKAETDAVASSLMQDGDLHEQQWFSSRVHTETAFDRAELIRIDQSTHCQDGTGGYHVLAYLSRPELGKALDAVYRDRAVGFRAAVENAVRVGGSPVEFTQSWQEATNAFSQMFSLACQYQAVTRQPHADLDQDRMRLRQLETARVDLVSGLDISIVLNASAEINGPAMEMALVGALGRLGLRANVGDCSSDSTLLLTLRTDLDWQTIIGAKYCKVRLLGDLRVCSSQYILEPILVDDPVLEGRGSDPALSLARRATSEALEVAMARALMGVLPVRREE